MSELLRQQQRAKEIRERLYGKPKIVNIAVQKRKLPQPEPEPELKIEQILEEEIKTVLEPEPEPEVKIEFPEYSFEDHSMIGPVEECGSIKRMPVINFIKSMCNLTPYTYEDIVGPKRQRDIVTYRHYIIRAVHSNYPNLSFPMIGRFFNRDHTTILHAVYKTKTSQHLLEKMFKRAS